MSKDVNILFRWSKKTRFNFNQVKSVPMKHYTDNYEKYPASFACGQLSVNISKKQQNEMK